MKIEFAGSALRRKFFSALGIGTSISIRRKLVYAALIFSISFAVKSLHAVDLAPVMYTPDQPAAGMAAEYDAQTRPIMEGRGILMPVPSDPSDTTALEHPPGYPIYLSAIYATFGRSYYRVQLIQNAINSFSPVMLFLIAGMLLGWRVGLASGIFAGIWHHLSYHSNLILPDSVCALPLLIGIYFLVKAERKKPASYALYAAAGLMIGLSVWLRANAMLMGPFLAVTLMVLSYQSSALARRRAVMALAAVLVIAPITIRNYLAFKQFVPVQIGMGLNLWTAIGQSKGGERFGAPTYDNAVARQEASLYNDPRYASSWYTPDGIERDHARLRKSLSVITGNPIWYTRAVLSRMAHMFNYSAEASLVLKSNDTRFIEAGKRDRDEMAEKIAAGQPLTVKENPTITPGHTLAAGEALFWLRPVARAAQRIEKETVLFFMILGALTSLVLSSRRSLLLMMVPAYYLLLQAMIHTEFRYTIPMHYFLFVLAATGWVLFATLSVEWLRSTYSRLAVSLQPGERPESVTEAGD